jgi:hypothetical protein
LGSKPSLTAAATALIEHVSGAARFALRGASFAQSALSEASTWKPQPAEYPKRRVY